MSLLSAFDSVLLTDGLLFSACQVFDRSPPRFCFTTCANNSKSCARGSRKRFDSRERTIGLESYRRIHQRVQGEWLGGLFERSTFSPTPLSCSRLLTISASPCQWSSVSQGAGATITLRWPYRVNVSSVVLHDRPNLSDQITSALLLFDDGSIYPVETLPNNGTAYVVPIDNVATETITLKITGVSSSTGSVGLAEFRVFGSIL